MKGGGIVEYWARFVWSEEGLWPGPVEFHDQRLSNHPIHIEFRGNIRKNMPLNFLRQFIDEFRQIQVDSSATSHKEVMDLLMVGCERAAIDLFSPDKEISLGHAVSEQIMISIIIPSNSSLTYITDVLLPRLNEVEKIGPKSVLLISKTRGDLGFVFDRLPKYIRNSFDWWLAPDEGEVIPLRWTGQIAGWILDGSRILGD